MANPLDQSTIRPRSPDTEIEAPAYSARVTFLGANGSGKSALASVMLTDYHRVIVLDSKGDFTIPWQRGDYVETSRPTGWEWLNNRIIYRPSRKYREDEWTSWFLERMLERGRKEGKQRPFVLYIDEGQYISNNGAKGPIADLAIVGRSLGIGLWVASQRPRHIPPEVRSEAWLTYVFFLQYQDDRDELIKLSGGQLTRQSLLEETEDYWFWELRRGKGGRILVRHLPPVEFTAAS